MAHLFDLETDEVTSNEDAIQDLKFMTLEEIIADKDSLESWSKICLNELRDL